MNNHHTDAKYFNQANHDFTPHTWFIIEKLNDTGKEEDNRRILKQRLLGPEHTNHMN